MLPSTEIVRILGKAFNAMRDYPHPYYSINTARNVAMRELSWSGYAPVLREDKTILIDGEMFKVLRYKNWTHYDIRHVGSAPKAETDR